MSRSQPNSARSTRLLVALLSALMLTVALIPGRAQGAESGLNVGITGAVNQQYANVLNALAPAWVRIWVGWNAFEPVRGQYNTADLVNLDRAITLLPPGTKIDLEVLGTPRWATADGSGDSTVPPADPADYARFAAMIATRYRAIAAALEIWNEPENTSFWKGSAAQYADLLKTAYPAIKAAAPNMTVVSAGMVGNDADYLGQLYDARAGGSFDAVGVHTDTACNTTSPYSYLRNPDGSINRFSFLGYRVVHATMVAHGDGAKPIYMTEFGWNTSTIVCPYGAWAGQKPGGVSQSEQATFLLQAYHCLAQDPYVENAMWFDFNDMGTANTTENRFGLVNSALAPKDSYAAFSSYAHHGDQLTDTCGNFTGPAITVVSPKPNITYTGPLKIKVAAASAAGVGRITLMHDGQLIRNFTSHAFPKRLVGRITWQGAKHLTKGKHVITVFAKDPQGNSTTVSVTVVKQ